MSDNFPLIQDLIVLFIDYYIDDIVTLANFTLTCRTIYDIVSHPTKTQFKKWLDRIINGNCTFTITVWPSQIPQGETFSYKMFLFLEITLYSCTTHKQYEDHRDACDHVLIVMQLLSPLL
jgi:hypothetical protein